MRGVYMSKKVDKGFELFYWNLSYRRKFIRTLWWTPLSVIALVLIWKSKYNIVLNTIITAALISINLAQLIYNYKKWKSNEQYSNYTN